MAEVITVSALNHYVKMLLDANDILFDIALRGEIANFVQNARSGHCYFSLRDEASSVKAVMFRADARRLAFRPEEGMRVVVRCRVTLYERDGAFQLYVNDMFPDGIGAAQLALEQLKAKLEQEGLFAPEHKKPLPAFPKCIGVVTSKTGAALQDIRNVLTRRWPSVQLLLCPVTVQGFEAAQQVADAIRKLDQRKEVDEIIVARGGGSREDLWVFNAEVIARAAYRCKKPLISAIGHEIDYTILDFVADRRAPTPSAAAELAVPDREEMRAALAQLTRRLCGSVQAGLDDRRQMLDALASANVLQNPSAWLSPRRQALRNTVQSLTHSAERRILNEKNELAALSARLDAMSPLKVLSRGYAIVSDENGKVIKRTEDAKPGDVLTARVEDGAITVQVQKTEKREMTDA